MKQYSLSCHFAADGSYLYGDERVPDIDETQEPALQAQALAMLRA